MMQFCIIKISMFRCPLVLIFVSHMGLYLQTVSLKTTLTASLFVKILTKREIKCMCIAMLISLQFIVFCETEIT